MENIDSFGCENCRLFFDYAPLGWEEKESGCKFCVSCAEIVEKSPEEEIKFLHEKLLNARVALSNIQARTSTLEGEEKPNYDALREASVKIIGLEKRLKDNWEKMVEIIIDKDKEIGKLKNGLLSIRPSYDPQEAPYQAKLILEEIYGN